MTVTVNARKTVSFRSPYTGRTFQGLTRDIYGRDGYLSGGLVTDNGATITIEPVKFVSRGIVSESLVTAVGLSVPTLPEPWFLLASVTDDDPDTGVIFSVTTSLISASTGVIIAFKTGGSWANPVPVDIGAAFTRASEAGVERLPSPVVRQAAGDFSELLQNSGLVVDPFGSRKPLSTANGESAQSSLTTAIPAKQDYAREDFVVLRQREPYTPEIKHIIGGVEYHNNLTHNVTGTRVSVYAKRGGAENSEKWYAHGSGSNVRVSAGVAGGGFAELTVVVAGGTVGEVWIAGQRDSDDAVILLYTDGDAVQMISFNATTGALIDGPVTIDTEASTCKFVRATMDSLEKLHVVYQHDDGTEEQVYYTKRVTASASFGAADVTPRRVTLTGVTSSLDDTAPDIAVDRLGRAHVVFISGAPPTIVGNFVYALIDENGDVVERTTYSTSADVGVQVSSSDPHSGFVSTAVASVQSARVAVNDFDEVMACCVRTDAEEVLLFAPDFEDRLGFALVNLVDSTDFIYGSGTMVSADIAADEYGAWIVAWTAHDGANRDQAVFRLNTRYAPGGLVSKEDLSVLHSVDVGGSLAGALAAATDERDMVLVPGCLGEFVLSHRIDATDAARAYDFGTYLPSSAIQPRPHPKDVYLGAISLPGVATYGDPTPEEDVSVFNVRPKRLNYPFLVGRDGDFQGYAALFKAVEEANRFGGQVIVRPGDHRSKISSALFPSQRLVLRSGVSLIGDGVAVLDTPLELGDATASYVVTVSGSIVQATTAGLIPCREGDLVELDGSGLHRVVAILPPSSPNLTRLLVTDAPDGTAPAGTALTCYPSGNRVENLVIDGGSANTRELLTVYKSHQASVRGVSFWGNSTGTTNPVVDIDGALSLVLDKLDFHEYIQAAGTTPAIEAVNTRGLVIRNAHADAAQVGQIDLDETNQRPMILGCTGMALIGGGARTNPVVISGADDGVDTSFSADTDSVSPVGKLVKTVDGALNLQDQNTRAATIKNIPFSDSGAGGSLLPTVNNSVLHAIHGARAHTISVGDGTNSIGDLNGTTEATIQAAIDAVAVGGTVYIKAGVYSLATAVTVNKAVTIVGDGPAITVLEATGAASALVINIASTVTLRNIGVIISGGTNAYAVDVTLAANESLFDTCLIQGLTSTSMTRPEFRNTRFYTPVGGTHALTGVFTDFTFYGCRFETNLASAASRCVSLSTGTTRGKFDGCSFDAATVDPTALVTLDEDASMNVTFRDCRFEAGAVGAVATAFEFLNRAMQDIHVLDCIIETPSGAGEFLGAPNSTSRGGNMVRGCRIVVPEDGDGISISGSGVAVMDCDFYQDTSTSLTTGAAVRINPPSFSRGIRVESCRMTACDYGVVMDPVGTLVGISIVKNVIDSSGVAGRGRAGIWLTSAGGDFTNGQINDNVIEEMRDDSGAITSIHGILLEESLQKSSVDGNKIDGIGATSATNLDDSYAIRLTAVGNTDASISNNVIRDIRADIGNYGIVVEGSLTKSRIDGNHLRNVGVTLGNAPSSQRTECIVVTTWEGISVSGNKIDTCGDSGTDTQITRGIHFQDPGGGANTDALCCDNVITNLFAGTDGLGGGGQEGIRVNQNASNMVVRGNTIRNLDEIGNTGFGIFFLQSDGVGPMEKNVIADNNISELDRGISVDVTNTTFSVGEHFTITGNSIKDCDSIGIEIDGDAQNHFVVANNNIECVGTGIDVGDVDFVSISGNVVSNSSISASPCIELSDSNTASIAGNTLFNGNTGLVAGRCIRVFSSLWVSITGNACVTNASGNGAAINTSEATVSSGVVIAGNAVRTNAAIDQGIRVGAGEQHKNVINNSVSPTTQGVNTESLNMEST